jgi:hypothetical protein
MNKNDFLQVRGFIYTDIQREIDIARSGQSAGNFIIALVLLCYTEFAGGLKRNNFSRGQASNNFNEFFNFMGARYKAFNQSVNVYSIFRCGLAHEYYVKKDCTIAMLHSSTRNGVGRNRSGQYYFIVEKYFEDFKKAFNQLEKILYP